MIGAMPSSGPRALELLYSSRAATWSSVITRYRSSIGIECSFLVRCSLAVCRGDAMCELLIEFFGSMLVVF